MTLIGTKKVSGPLRSAEYQKFAKLSEEQRKKLKDHPYAIKRVPRHLQGVKVNE